MISELLNNKVGNHLANLKFKFNLVNFESKANGVDRSLISKTYVLLNISLFLIKNLISIINSVKLSKLLIELDKSSI